jgi:hypothetical protein
MGKIIYILLFISTFGFSQSRGFNARKTVASVSSQRVNSFILGELKAFPSADGGGKFATGGRGGTVVEMQNISESGANSLRSHLEGSGNVIIIPTTGGAIDATSVNDDIRITNGNITFLGQFAPNGAVMLYGEEIEINNADNIVLRHLRIRLGDDGIGTGKDALRVICATATCDDFIMDHLSVTAGADEVVSFGGSSTGAGGTITGATLQYSIIADAFNTGKGLLIGANVYDASVLNSYLANNKERNPRASYGETKFEFINNVIYNWDQPPVQATWENDFDVMYNVFISEGAPAGGGTTITYTESAGNGAFVKADTEVYVEGNYRDYILNNTLGSDLITYLQPSKVLNLGTRIIKDSPIKMRDWVFDNVGANLVRDQIENDLINDALNGTGTFVTAESQTTTLPSYSGGTVLNPDGDYIPHDWKLSHGLTPGVNYFDIKPEFFYIENTGRWYDNRERTGGTYEGYEYDGGTLTGNNLYTWFEIYAEFLAGGFEVMHY